MPTVEAIDETVVENRPQQARRRGRPPKSRSPEEQNSIATEDRPCMERDEYRKLGLWRAIQKMTDDDWSDKMLYVGRVVPYTVNRTTGQNYGSLHKGAFPKYTKAMFEELLGGGRFHFRLNSGKGSVCEAIETFDGNLKLLENEALKEAPPVAPPAAPTADIAGMFRSFIGYLEKEREQKERAGDQSNAQALAGAIGIIETAAKKSLEWREDALKNSSNQPSLTELIELSDKLRPKDQMSPMDWMNFALKLSDNKKNPEPPPAPVDPVEQLKKTVNTLRQMQADPLFAGAGISGKPDWRESLVLLLSKAIDNLPILWQQWRESQIQQFNMLMALKAVGTNVHPGPVATPQPAPVAGPIPSATVGDPFEAIKIKIVRMFKENDAGDFVARVIQLDSPMMYEVISKSSKEQIAKFIQEDPVLREISQAEDFGSFIDDLISFFAAPAAETQPDLEN